MTEPRSGNEKPTGFAVYAAYIKELQEAQETRKSSFEQRGLAVITTSGALVTLLFGLTALTVKRAATFDLPALASTFLVFALVLFVLAAFCALFTNLPRSYEGVRADGLKTAVNDRWDDSDSEASRMVALTRLKVIATAKKVNDQKAWALAAGIVLEILAVTMGAAAMAIVLWD